MSKDRRLIEVVIRPLIAFVRLEAASGIVLLACAVVALVWANLDAGSYGSIFDTLVAGWVTPRAVINDGLMAVFFLVVGMEIKRELVTGELSSVAKAALPAIAALGGMVVPAVIFAAATWGGPGLRGLGIPMATDIAFCVGILTILGDRVPRALVVFITALAIVDDIGGILVIAVFYGHGLHAAWLLGAAGLTLALFVVNRAHVTWGLVYALLGVALWYALRRGGIHAAIAGVVVGLMVPARARGDGPAPVDRFIDSLHGLVAFFVMPVFALANAGVSVHAAAFGSPVAIGAALGLVAGKPAGIFAFTVIAVKLKLAPLPGNASLGQLFAVAVVGGIGFTVSLFIAALAFPGAPALLEQAKLGTVVGSVAAGAGGFLLLRLRGRAPREART